MDSAGPGAAASTGDTLRAVELDRRDIFDPDERGWVARVGNALHIQTRAATIRRELLFRPGEPFDSARVAESERNLRALGVFRRVRIDTVRTDSGLVARVLTKDGWSTKADWRFRSTGGEVAFTIGLVEDNLLGTASSAAVRYRKTPDRSCVTLGFRRPRLFAGAVGLAAAYEDRSDGRLNASRSSSRSIRSPRGAGSGSRPRIATSACSGSSTAPNEARDTLTHRYSLVAWIGGVGAARVVGGVPAAGRQAQVRREDFRPEGSAAPFAKTVTGAVGPYLTWSRAQFPGDPRGRRVRPRGGRRPGAHRAAGLMVGAEGIRLRARRASAPQVGGAARRPGAGRVRLPGGAGGRTVRRGAGSTAARSSSPPPRCSSRARTRWASCTSKAGGWRIRFPAANSTSGSAPGPAHSGAMPSPATAPTSAPPSTGSPSSDDFLGMIGLGIAGFVDHGGAWYAG